jgi:hypothetical protein
MNNVYGYRNIGEGYFYNPPRQFQMSLAVDGLAARRAGAVGSAGAFTWGGA